MIREKISKVNLNAPSIILVATLWVVFILNITFAKNIFNDYPDLWSNFVFYFQIFLFIAGLFVFELMLLATVMSLRLAVSVSILTASLASYFMNTYSVIFDAVMIRNLFETNTAEASDLMTLGLMLNVFLTGVLPILLLWLMPFKANGIWHSIKFRITAAFVALLLILSSVVIDSAKMTSFAREHRNIHVYANPIYPFYSTFRYAQEVWPFKEELFYHEITQITEVSPQPIKNVTILIIGETARADHFSQNGYHRQTNIYTSEHPEIINFNHFYSCGTSTSISVPCMFSYQNQDSFDVTIAPFEENVLDTLARAGVEVVWRDNNSGSKHVADRVTYQDYSRPVNESYVCAGECRDETMLTGLDELIRSSNGDVLIVLHQMGSHGPAYFQRYDETFEVFTPVCLSSELSQCTQNEIINAYDNSIIYTDYVINESIKLLEKFNAYSTNVIYISDHGESLGEAGLYLHGLPYGFAPESQTHVPAMVWSGDRSNIDRALTSKNSENVYTHDNLAQTLLSLFGISTTNSKELPQSFIVFR